MIIGRRVLLAVFVTGALLSLYTFIPTYLTGGVGGVGADCSDGCDDYISGYGGEYYCQGGTYCCTGHGCGSYACSQAGWNAMVCNGNWTCCDYNYADCVRCFSSYVYALAGTCDPCPVCTAVDGGWSGWGTCSNTCGTGTQYRYCNNPSPSCGGDDCVGVSSQACTDYSNCPCDDTAPTNLIVSMTGLDRAKITWSPGSNGSKQMLRVGTSQTEVENGCPTAGACIVKEDNLATTTNSYEITSGLVLGTTYYWRVVTYSDATCNKSTLISSAHTASGSIIGRIWTDADYNGSFSAPGDLWRDSTISCGGLEHNGFTMTEGGINRLSSWQCNSGGAYYATQPIMVGPRDITLSGFPTGYDCAHTSWSYNTHNGTVWGTASSGAGCTANQINITGWSAPGYESNHLTWYLKPINSTPTSTIVPSSISYNAPGVLYPILVDARDQDAGGGLRIKTTPSVGDVTFPVAIWFEAWGSPSDGIWPIVNIYGWDKVTGDRRLITDYYGNGNIIVDSAAPVQKGMPVPYADYFKYSHFDIEFANDGGNPATGEDRNLYVGEITLCSDDMFCSQFYTVRASDASWVRYDRGDPDDGNNVIKIGDSLGTWSWDPVTKDGRPFAGMYWGGALRLPIIWRSPATPVAGNVSFAITDQYNAATGGSVTLTPVTRNISGVLWYTPADTVVDCNNRTPVMNQGTVAFTGSGGRSAPVNSSGQYSISNFFGNVDVGNISNLPTTYSYAPSCMNSIPSVSSGLSIYNIPQSSPSNQVVDIGIRITNAKRWPAFWGGDVFTGGVEYVKLPLVDSGSYVKPELSTGYYVMSYNKGASNPGTLFSKLPVSVGPTTYTESTIQAGDVGSTFGSISNEFLQSQNLSKVIQDIKTNKGITSCKTTLSASYESLTANGVYCWDVANISVPYYLSGSSSVAVVLIPSGTSGSSLTITSFRNYYSYLTGRVVIITDRKVIFGSSNSGESGYALKTESYRPHVEASIITSGDIEVQNYLGGTTSPGSIIVEGPLVTGGNLKIFRDLGNTGNSLQPSFFVRFNPNYAIRLNKLAKDNVVPALSPLFIFNYTQGEK